MKIQPSHFVGMQTLALEDSFTRLLK